ncbi:MAG: [FeFe] hydrogenase H-cluster radical SAM maturase HydE [Patescibacteria group bacterium]|jgi:biotin synthase
MCLTIPAKILKTSGTTAEIEKDNTKITINISAIPEAKKDDWILYISDFAIKIISTKDAKEILTLLESRPKISNQNLSKKFTKIIEKIRLNHKITKSEIIYLLNTKGDELETLFAEADVARKAHLKDFICIHGIIEFSNYCSNDCHYCGIRCQNKELQRFRLKPVEIIEGAKLAYKKGYKILVLQSGEDHYYATEMLIDIVKKIKSESKLFLILSIGERDLKTYKDLKKAGANGVLFRFETSNPKLFKNMHPHGKTLEKRLAHLKFFKKLGYYIATGSIVGLPNQTIDDLADDIIETRRWANMITLGPFIPAKNTPLASFEKGSVELTLKMIAIYRLLNSGTRIPVTTAIETLDKNGRKKALSCGANSLMFNITPDKYRKLYQIYDNKYFSEEKMWEKYGLFDLEGSYRMLEEKMAKELNK